MSVPLMNGAFTGEDAGATQDHLVCRCREVSEADVLQAIRDGARSVRGVKVRTRATTGLCQGQTCGPLIESILRRELGPASLPDDRPARAPVRALPLDVLAASLPFPRWRGAGGEAPSLPSPPGRGAGGEALSPLSPWERGRG